MRLLLTCALLLLTTATHAQLATLQWLVGHWSGPSGQATLEETWLPPAGNSMVAAVRMYSPAGTAMVELITIREQDGNLQFHLQQFNTDMTPRTPVQEMFMVDTGPRSVTFAALDQTATSGLLRVKYQSPEASQLHITVGLAEGDEFKATLQRQD